MSNNIKNEKRPGFLRNFIGSDIIHSRYLVLDDTHELNDWTGKEQNVINEKLWELIQNLNIQVKNRQLPYITLISVSEVEDGYARLILINGRNKNQMLIRKGIRESPLKRDEISHLIAFRLAPNYNRLTMSSLDSIADAKMIVSRKALISASIDILLDISMFNSYSFLRNLNIHERTEFNEKKVRFFKNNKLDCFYELEELDKYYSLAFSARETTDCIDIGKYISLWEKFIQTYYPDCSHEESSIREQLQHHVDIGELPFKKLCKDLSKKPDGTYLVLRINREYTKNTSFKERVSQYFKIDNYEIGSTKIANIDEFNDIRYMLENLDVSAYKIVVKHNPRHKNAKSNP